MEYEKPEGLRIEAFFNCDRCVRECPADTSVKDYADLAVGMTSDGCLQVWCNRHQLEVLLLDQERIKDLKRRLDERQFCECPVCTVKRLIEASENREVAFNLDDKSRVGVLELAADEVQQILGEDGTPDTEKLMEFLKAKKPDAMLTRLIEASERVVVESSEMDENELAEIITRGKKLTETIDTLKDNGASDEEIAAYMKREVH